MFSRTLPASQEMSESIRNALVKCSAVAMAFTVRITFLFGIKVTLSSYRQCILMVFYEKYRVFCIFVGERR